MHNKFKNVLQKTAIIAAIKRYTPSLWAHVAFHM